MTDTTTVPATVPATTATPKTPLRMGMAPTNIDEGWRMSQVLAKSDLVPKNFRNKPEDILVAIQMGVEIGFAPMQALQSIAVINGRPSVWGDGFLALIMGSPLYREHDEYYEVNSQRVEGLTADALTKDDTAAVCTFWRKGKPEPVTRRFSIAQAKKAQLFDKRDTPWQTYPDRMLLMRARSWAGRDCFPDLLRGIRTAEEALDERPPIDTAVVRAIPGPTPAPTTPPPGSRLTLAPDPDALTTEATAVADQYPDNDARDQVEVHHFSSERLAALKSGVVLITTIDAVPTRNPNVTRYTIAVAGGPDWPPAQTRLTTINETFASRAESAWHSEQAVAVATTKGKYGYELTSIEFAHEVPF